MPSLPTGLQRHSKSGTYFLRRRIPQDLLHCYPKGRKEITRSLRTKELRVARERHRREEAALTQEWDEFRQQTANEDVQQSLQAARHIRALTPEAIREICDHFEAASLAGEEARRNADDGLPSYEEEEVDEYQDRYRRDTAELKRTVALGKFDVFRRALDGFLDIFGYRVNASDEEMTRLTRAFAHAAVRTNEKLLKRFEGEHVETPSLAQTLATPMLSELTQDYLTFYEKLGKAAMLKKVSGVLAMLLEVIGDKPIGTLKQSDLKAFLDGVQSIPPRWKDVCRKRKISLAELIDLEEGEISKATFHGTYLAALGPFIEYSARDYRDRGWPPFLTVEGIKYIGSRTKSEAEQRAMRPQELERLFEGPEMKAFAANPREAHCYWLPHLALFTGARVNEMCQVNPQVDIRQDESGIWFLDFNDESPGHEEIKKSVKTGGSKRAVPIHSQLIELGFLQYVHHVKDQGHTLLFPAFPPSVKRAGAKAAQWFGKLLGKLKLRDVTPGERLVGMHAFRSTFLRQAMLLGELRVEAITGHSSQLTEMIKDADGRPTGVVRAYQGDIPIPKLSDVLEHIRFDGLNFYSPVPPLVPPKCRPLRGRPSKSPKVAPPSNKRPIVGQL